MITAFHRALRSGVVSRSPRYTGATAGYLSGYDLKIAYPSEAKTGDVAYLFFAAQDSTALSPPAGWDLISADGSDAFAYCLCQRAVPSSPADFTVLAAYSTGAAGVMVTCRNVSTYGVYVQSLVYAEMSNPPSATVSSTGMSLIFGGLTAQFSNSAQDVPTGYSNVARDYRFGSGIGADVIVGVELDNVSGTVNPGQFAGTAGVDARARAIHLVVRP